MHLLTEIGEKYKEYTDKIPSYGRHSYSEFYGPLFFNHRNQVKKVLELGVRWGGSLMMWHDFFPNALIIGIDTEVITKGKKGKSLAKQISDNKRIKFIRMDAYSRCDIQDQNDTLSNLDIVIDDASHIKEHQLKGLEIYHSRLTPGGFLCIEDIISYDNAYWIIKNFRGDRNKLSLVDRTKCDDSYHDERLLLYTN